MSWLAHDNRFDRSQSVGLIEVEGCSFASEY